MRGGAGRPTAENTGISSDSAPFVSTPDDGEPAPAGLNQNLLAGRGAPTSRNEVWVGDITYIPLVARSGSGRFGYLCC